MTKRDQKIRYDAKDIEVMSRDKVLNDSAPINNEALRRDFDRFKDGAAKIAQEDFEFWRKLG